MADRQTTPVDALLTTQCVEEKKQSLEVLLLEIRAARTQYIRENIVKEVKELKERQAEVKKFHEVIAKINALTDGDGEVKVDEELYDMLQKAVSTEEEGSFAKIDNLKIFNVGESYKPEDRVRVIETVRMHIEDLNTQNEMQIQSVTQYNNELFETYQMLRAIDKPYDAAGRQCARGIAGR